MRIWIGRVVDVDAGGARTGGGLDAADRDVVEVDVEGDARRELGEVREGLDALNVHLGGGEGADAFGHLAE